MGSWCGVVVNSGVNSETPSAVPLFVNCQEAAEAHRTDVKEGKGEPKPAGKHSNNTA